MKQAKKEFRTAHTQNLLDVTMSYGKPSKIT